METGWTVFKCVAKKSGGININGWVNFLVRVQVIRDEKKKWRSFHLAYNTKTRRFAKTSFLYAIDDHSEADAIKSAIIHIAEGGE